MAILSANAVLDAIEGYYEALLDREPSLQDSAFFLATYRISPDLEAIRAVIARSSEARERIGDLFREVLGRPPDAGGLAFFQAALAAGASLESVRAELAQSPEARGLVNDLYQDVFGRNADQPGLAFFQRLLANDDAGLEDVRATLAFSSEAAQQISAVYQDVLGRDVDLDGVAYFQAALADDAIGIDDVAELLAGSDELRGGLAAAYAQATGEAIDGAMLDEYAEHLASGSITLAKLLPEIGALRPAKGNDDPSEEAPPELPDDEESIIVPIPPSPPAMTFLVFTDRDIQLTASPGADCFVFTTGQGGDNVIANFDPTMDVLQFAPFTFADRAALDATLANTPDGVQLHFPLGGSLRLVGLDAESLTATAVALS